MSEFSQTEAWTYIKMGPYYATWKRNELGEIELNEKMDFRVWVHWSSKFADGATHSAEKVSNLAGVREENYDCNQVFPWPSTKSKEDERKRMLLEKAGYKKFEDNQTWLITDQSSRYIYEN